MSRSFQGRVLAGLGSGVAGVPPGLRTGKCMKHFNISTNGRDHPHTGQLKSNSPAWGPHTWRVFLETTRSHLAKEFPPVPRTAQAGSSWSAHAGPLAATGGLPTGCHRDASRATVVPFPATTSASPVTRLGSHRCAHEVC